jgi:2-hydroxychromene-2-carboxylate isomerase
MAKDLFVGFDTQSFPATSLPAFGLANAAYRRDLAVGEEVSLALRSLLFERGDDISEPSVIKAVARTFNLRPDAVDVSSVDRDHRDGQARGVVGSPHFFTPGGSFFCPTLDISRDEHGDLQIAFDDVGFRDFLAAVFA